MREVKGFTSQPRRTSSTRHDHLRRAPDPDPLDAIEVETRESRQARASSVSPPSMPRSSRQTARGSARRASREAGARRGGGPQGRSARSGAWASSTGKYHDAPDRRYVEDGHTSPPPPPTSSLRRVDWLVPIETRRRRKKALPEPATRLIGRPWTFRVVSGEHALLSRGLRTLEIDWRERRLPEGVPACPEVDGAARSEATRGAGRSLRVPKADRDAAATKRYPCGSVDLTPDQLRALADLEDDRRRRRQYHRDGLPARAAATTPRALSPSGPPLIGHR